MAASLTVNIAFPPENEIYRLPYFVRDAPIIINGNTLRGTVSASFTSKMKRNGFRVSVISQIRLKSDGTLYQLGELCQPISFGNQSNATAEFGFKELKTIFSTYYGPFFDVRHILRVGTQSNYQDYPFYFLSVDESEKMPAEINFKIKNVFEFRIFIVDMMLDVSGCLVGQIFFSKISIRIVQMLFQIVCMEKFHLGLLQSAFQSVIVEHEILDGTPASGCLIPFRIFFGGIQIWPAVSIDDTLNVSYKVQWVAVDEQNNRYYQEMNPKILRCKK